IDFLERQTGSKEGLEHEHISWAESSIERVRVDALLNVLGDLRVIEVDELVELVFLGKLDRDGHLNSSNEARLEGLDSGAENNTISSSSTARQSPEQIGILSGRGLYEATIGKDNLKLERLIGT